MLLEEEVRGFLVISSLYTIVEKSRKTTYQDRSVVASFDCMGFVNVQTHLCRRLPSV